MSDQRADVRVERIRRFDATFITGVRWVAILAFAAIAVAAVVGA